MMIIILKLIGGLGLLLYGMDLAGEGLQKFAAQKLRAILNLMTRNRVWALLLGTFVTLTLQSSSATTVMMVSFVTSSLVSLSHAFSILLGANIGTTFTVQILAFKISDYALLAILLGFLAMKFFKSEQVKYFGMALIGFGLIFYGMGLMDQAVEPLKDADFLMKGLDVFRGSFWLSLLVGLILTFMLQSSAAAIVFVMSLVSQGLISPADSIPLVLGANLGTCDSAILASLTRGAIAWRLALGYLSIRFISITLIYLLLPWFQELIRIFTGFLSRPAVDQARYVANTHTLFNLIASFALLPFTGWIAKVVQMIIPIRQPPEIFDFRKEGLEAGKKAILEMTRRASQMITTVIKVFRDNDLKALRKILDADEEIDLIYWQMKRGLTSKAEEKTNDEQTIKCLWAAGQLEHIGDLLSKDVVELGRKKIYEGLEFSAEGQAELEDFHQMIYNLFEKAFTAFIQGDRAVAQEVLSEYEDVKKKKWQMHVSHLRRFGKGIQETLNTSSIHMDLITNLERICDHSASVAKEVLN